MPSLGLPAPCPPEGDTRAGAGLVAAGLVTAGLAAGAVQVLVFRELLIAAGGNEVSMGLMLAAWLLCGAWGAAWGSRGSAAEPAPALRLLGRWCVVCLPLPLLSLALVRCFSYALTYLTPILLGLPAGRPSLLAKLLTLAPGQVLSLPQITILALLGVLPVALPAGAIFAAGARAYLASRRERSAGAGAAYALDAVGHLGGGGVLAWVALQHVDPLLMAWLLGLALAAVGLLLVLRPAPGRRGARLPRGAALAALLGLGLWAAVWVPTLSTHLERLRYPRGEAPLVSRRTVYGDLAVTRFGREGCYLYYDGLPVACSPPPESVQVEVDFALLQHPAPQRVLLVGGGAFGGLAAVLRHRPAQVDYVELDPALVETVAPWLASEDRVALASPRVRTIAADARLWAKRLARDGAPAAYDAVLVLMPPPASAQLNRYYTEGWFRDLAALTPQGVVAWQMPSSEVYLRGPLLALNGALLRAARPAYPAEALLPGEVMTVVSSRRADYLSEDPRLLLQRARRRGLDTGLLEATLADRLDPYDLAYMRGQLAAAAPRAANTDERPLAYFLYQAWWLESLHPGWGYRLARAADASPALLAVGLALLLGVWGAGTRTRRGQRSLLPGTVALVGLAGMAVELVLLLNFQAYYGYVFQQVGVIVGCFMVGLALGSWRADRRLARGLEPGVVARRWAALLLGGAVLLVAWPHLLALLWSVASAPWAASLVASGVFPVLAGAWGWWVGAAFPLAAALAGGGAGPFRARTVAALYAADLLGAALAALLVGTYLLPVLGAALTCGLVALAIGGAGLLAVLTPRRGQA